MSLLAICLLVTMPALVKADTWILSPGKGALAPDKAFSAAVRNELSARGLDWGPWIALAAVENPGSIPTAGKTYVSPDQKYSVQTTIDDRQFYFLIRDSKTGQLTRLPSANFPVLVQAWSPDSKSLVAVVHAPMTSFLKIIHWNGSGWDPFEIDAPEGNDDDKYHVVGWQFKPGFLEAAYIVNHRAGDGTSPGLYRCAFHIDPASGAVSHVRKATISQKEYISLRSAGN